MTEKTINKAGKIRNYLIVAGCALLIGVNILTFITFPRLMAPVAIIISNVVTMLITAVAFRPVSRLIESQAEARQTELLERVLKEKELEEKVVMLEAENEELVSKLDTRDQTAAQPVAINYTFKLEQLEFAKKGYVVKEIDLNRLDSEKYTVPSNRWENIKALVGDPGEKKIQYIHKFYYKVSIGLDFAKIKYRIEDGNVIFQGVKFAKLHDISSELVPDKGDIERCEILSVSGGKAGIINDKSFADLKKTFSDEQEQTVKDNLEMEMINLCQMYTEVFRESMRKRYPSVLFVESIDDSDRTWYTLNGTQDRQVAEIASSMLMLTSVIGQTKSIEEQTLNQISM